MGCDPKRSAPGSRFPSFQSTHPVWGATSPAGCWEVVKVISIHAPRVGCDRYSPMSTICTIISIHAPRVGCDPAGRQCWAWPGYFNPRTPCGVRRSSNTQRRYIPYFNPRTPCGVRQEQYKDVPCIREFQSTHPVWGATGQPDPAS